MEGASAYDAQPLLLEGVVPSLRKIPSKPARLADQVYARLMEAILDGTIAQGDRLIQENLAEELAVSRTPVREALLRLETEGVLEKVGRKGFVVKTIDEKMVRSIYQAREAVEGYAAHVVAERASAKVVDRLEAKMRKLGPTSNIQSAYEANRLAHRAIVEATGNDYMVELFDAIWGRSIALRIYADLWATENEHRPVIDNHYEILEALRTGDGTRAAKVMIEHIRDGLDQQIAVLASRVPARAE